MAVKKILSQATLAYFTLLSLSCSSERLESTSTLQHRIDGWPRLSTEDFTCKNVQEGDYLTSLTNMIYFSREGDQEYLTYQEDHLKNLLNGSKKILPSWLNFANFCVGAPSNIRFQMNGMSAKSGSLAVFQGTLFSGDETVFAALMAHELGHILGQKLTIEQFAEQKKTGNDSPLFNDEFKANWDEQSADEIGLELYLRAGWPFGGFLSMFKAMAAEDALAVSSAKNTKELSSKDRKSQPCIRGTASHPSVCWRLANADDEYKEHKNAYLDFGVSKNSSQNFSARHKELQSKYKKYQLDEKNKPKSED